MKKFWFVSLFIFFLCIPTQTIELFAQSTPGIYLYGRPVGAGTRINVQIYGSGELSGFEMSIENKGNIKPSDFYLGDMFYYYKEHRNDWMYSSFLSDQYLKIAGVGNSISFIEENIGTLYLSVENNIDGNNYLPEIEFYDGENYWLTVQSPFNVINMDHSAYGDMNYDGILNITDGKYMLEMLGKIIANPAQKVISDLDGDGLFYSYDIYLLLRKLVNPDYTWPIFFNNNCCDNGGLGLTTQTTPVLAEWKKIGDKWGLFSKEDITNGDLTGNNISSLSTPNNSNLMFKKIAEKVYFVGEKGIKVGNPILISDVPVALTGTLNNNRKIVIETSVTDITEEKENSVPTEFNLSQNYPNPFNPSTTISYQLPTDGFVTLKVYDIVGKEVATLVNEEKPAGSYEAKFDASQLSSGIYIYRLSAGSFTKTQKMTLMK